MADKLMNEFTPATDIEYIYAETADGSQVRIKKSDLIGTLFEDRGYYEGDVNHLLISGMYYTNGNTLNAIDSGLFIVFSSDQAVCQFSINVFNGILHFRSLTYNDNNWDIWTKWNTISFT